MALIPSTVSTTDVTNQINAQVPSLISAANGVVKTVSNAINQTVTNSSTLVDATGLSFNVTPGTYYIHAVLGYTVASLQGAKQALAGTATITTTSLSHKLFSLNTTSLIGVSRVTNPATALGAAPAGVTGMLGEIEGTMVVTVSGTIVVQFSGQTATPVSDTTLLANSYLIYTKLS